MDDSTSPLELTARELQYPAPVSIDDTLSFPYIASSTVPEMTNLSSLLMRKNMTNTVSFFRPFVDFDSNGGDASSSSFVSFVASSLLSTARTVPRERYIPQSSSRLFSSPLHQLSSLSTVRAYSSSSSDVSFSSSSLSTPNTNFPKINPSSLPSSPASKQPEKKKDNDSSWLMFKSFLAGGAAGATAKTIVAPLDRIKIIFQISEQSFTFRGVYRELLRTFHTEGFTALFRGNGAQILRVYPYSGIQLTAFDSYSKFLLYEKQALLVHEDGIPTTNPKKNKNNPHVTSSTVQLTPFERMLAGSAAGATSVAATYPLDLMRARLAVQRATVTGNIKYEGLYPSFLLMRKEYGWKSFYRGMAPTLLGILPYAGISFATYGTLKQMSRERAKNQHHSSSSSSSSIEPSIEPSFEPSTLERLLYGGIAGLAGQSSTYPLDIVRRRMQTEGFTPFHAHVTSATRTVSGTVSSSSSSTVTTKDTSQRNPVSSNGQRIFGVLRRSEGGMVDTLQRIYYREGKRGLFKGLSMNVIKGPIAVGVSFTTYDFLKRLLDIPEGAGMGSSG